MDATQNYSIDHLKSRWLDLTARRAFDEFVDLHDVPEAHQRSLITLQGRGYRPPTTHAGWVEIYKFWKDIATAEDD